MAQLTPTRIDTPTRLSAVVCLLVLVWIVTYWLWQPRRVGDLPVTFADPVRAAGPRPESPPPTPPPETPDPARSVMDPLAHPAQPRIDPPRFDEYIVQEGDTVDAIAERFYKTREHAAAILQANPFVDPTKLIPGRTRLLIPLDPTNVQGRVLAAGPPSGGPDGPSAAPDVSSSTPASRTVEYTIARDDTLWGIAEAYYGKGHLWRKIYEANRDVIANPDRPPVGRTIRIPPID